MLFSPQTTGRVCLGPKPFACFDTLISTYWPDDTLCDLQFLPVFQQTTKSVSLENGRKTNQTLQLDKAWNNHWVYWLYFCWSSCICSCELIWGTSKEWGLLRKTHSVLAGLKQSLTQCGALQQPLIHSSSRWACSCRQAPLCWFKDGRNKSINNPDVSCHIQKK